MRTAKLLTDEIRPVNSTSLFHYAVISVRSGHCCEWLVIAYPEEKSLQGLIAAPSILGLGYRSREEAQASIDRRATTACHSGLKWSAALLNPTASGIQFVANHHCPGVAGNFVRTCCILRDFLQRSLALAIIALYSKNLLSTAFRALISV